MGVSCQILINKRNGGHKPGQAVNGVVKYALNEPLEVKSVVLSLIGEGKCEWTETTITGKIVRIITYTGNEEHFTASLAVIEKSNDEVVTIPAGSYEFPFEFFLPKDIPPSYTGDVGKISYKLILKFKRPERFKFNKKFSAEFPVYSCITNEGDKPFIFGLEKTLTKPFSKKNHVVSLKGEIDKDILAPEEKINLNILVINDTSIDITGVKSELIRYVTYTADCGRKMETTMLVKGSKVQSKYVPKNATANLTQEVPTLPDMYSVKSRVLNVEYRLRVTARLPVPHINAYVEVPIVVGDKKIENCPVDDPPSYWEVVCAEEKVKE